jgi:hypothetical protein
MTKDIITPHAGLALLGEFWNEVTGILPIFDVFP